MADVQTTTTAATLFDTIEVALAVTALPEYESVDADGQLEVLKYLGAEGCWALVNSTADDEYIAIDTTMARDLVLRHFDDWLLLRGFQLQVRCYAKSRRWTLVDCLSASDGGGDRLDVDYPTGEDQLQVAIASIIAVHTLR